MVDNAKTYNGPGKFGVLVRHEHGSDDFLLPINLRSPGVPPGGRN